MKLNAPHHRPGGNSQIAEAIGTLTALQKVQCFDHLPTEAANFVVEIAVKCIDETAIFAPELEELGGGDMSELFERIKDILARLIARTALSLYPPKEEQGE